MILVQAGRPKDEALTQKILSTTYALFSQHNYADISLVKIAETAGVSRKALYSRWHNKAELLIDAFSLFHPPSLPPRHTNSKTQLIDYLEKSTMAFNQNITLFRDVLIDILQHPDTLDFYEQTFAQASQQAVMQILENGIKQGEFNTALNCSLVCECLRAVLQNSILRAEQMTRADIEVLVTFLLK